MPEMIAVNVLRSCRIAAAGTIYGRDIVAGTTDEVPDNLLDGLRSGGWVEEIAPTASPPEKSALSAPATDDPPPADPNAKSKTPTRRK